MDELWPFLRWVVAVASAAAVVVVVMLVVDRAIRRGRARVPALVQGWLRVRRPLAALLLAIALRVAFAATAERGTVREIGLHVLLVLTIASAVWFAATIVVAWLEHTRRRVVARKEDDRDRRRTRTQMLLIQRLVNAAFVVLGVAMVLMTFPGVEQVGATILASAGLLSVVVGIAAQSSLGNLFAGLQIAFTDAVRIGDVVEVDGTWSTIEDITLSYVVVSIWDERHKVLPSTYFTSQPFINWSRTGDTVTGVVHLELDWRTDIDALRAAFDAYVSQHPAWDGRGKSLLVTDSTGGHITVRALVTTANTGDDWTLRCDVREHLVVWLRENDPQALPVRRLTMSPDPAAGGEQPA
ncbi:Small-conductance mechanosensitive channel [Georgenia satyanarayanai]|uniref:Small-conductance mechanosensitive channel n=1 Tax=Georgenia satyanarayanai TaxID=860221 RepID=A0A2Y9BVC1_9MICO|nr:mechanosensitive ion channel domain-containing protein [Georgenia satyanarayanai]PYG02240.1 small-conductance mechanosensitive channel [Georgenia satyanarayanai]SSA37082.1 Small-conductance mechanosensitive channel [Georgenia satyanarayanai]